MHTKAAPHTPAIVAQEPPSIGVRALSGCTANLQVGPGIFADTNQVTGVQCPYAYRHLW